MKIGYTGVQTARASIVKDVLDQFEVLMKKYKISLEDYHIFRAILKSRVNRFDNSWKELFMIEFSREKWEKRINKAGEKEETYGSRP
jgi:hypothetical protein